MKIPVSVIIPVYNAGDFIEKVVDAIFKQDYPGEIETIVVNDGSSDDTSLKARTMITSVPKSRTLIVIDQPNKGAAEATNTGIRNATHDIVCSVDSDVLLYPDWLKKVVQEFSDPKVAAVQGYYMTPKDASFWAKMMGYDVELRYDSIKSKYVSHVCTGNTAYRRDAIERVGLFDSSFVYGYDNDMSYRLQKAGYKLVFLKDAQCDHYWKSTLYGYLKQQFRAGYGRLKLIKKHPDRKTGDSVSNIRMILQVPLMFLILVLLLVTIPFYFLDYINGTVFLFPAFFLAFLLCERFHFAVGAVKKHNDLSALAMPFVHLLRNLVWCFATVSWLWHNLSRKVGRG
ncbi:MAG: glycosyltransferase [Nitrospirae bacterium]|nr:MAG: glycosyltransferase [Nitrospirota bacterium]